jgi:NCAIR mutase (PurE)-related protein
LLPSPGGGRSAPPSGPSAAAAGLLRRPGGPLGLVDRPVIAVPTSVGYGAAFGGLAALLAMLNSCAAGVALVNLDNGFGAGCLAALLNRKD